MLSTLHTNDASGAIPRLIDMKIEPFLLSSAMVGVVAQRLVRRICEKCRAPFEPPAEVLSPLGIARGKGKFAHGKGCPACGGTGYHGRVGIFEVLEVTDEVRELITAKASAEELARAVRRHGMGSLRDDAIRQASEGVTTLEEALRVTNPDSPALEAERGAASAEL